MASSDLAKEKLSGKVVVVTGASMGIGEAIVELFVDNGAQVVLLSRDSNRLEAARARIGRSGRDAHRRGWSGCRP